MTGKTLGWITLGLLAVILLACAFPGMLSGADPNEINLTEKFSPPGREHPMGTDNLGRDLFARVLYGGRVTLGSSLIIALGSVILAVLWAAISAYTGGWWDEVMTRVVDLLLILPGLLFALLLVSLLQPGMKGLVIALTLVRWPGYARILRGRVMSLLGREYLTAARALGARDLHIIRRHILPNLLELALTFFGLSFAGAILSISSLSFLGFGVQLPHPEWGAMVNAARPFLQTRPYLMIFPGLAIVVTILLVNISLRLLERR